ncbi:MAG: dienelactone hydrolase, partial [Rhodothermales bacterium]
MIRFFLLALFSLAAFADSPAMAFWTAYDPHQEPLDAEIVQEWADETANYQLVRFRLGALSGSNKSAAPVIAAYFGYPKAASAATKVPGVVHIHGGGQRAHKGRVGDWAKLGFACISINWGGKSLEAADTPNTDWDGLAAGFERPGASRTDDLLHHNGVDPGPNTLFKEPHLLNSSWSLIAMSARRALTFLEQRPEVDGTKLGVEGHSMGGRATVLTAIDPRVKAASPSVGGSGFLYRDIWGLPGSARRMRAEDGLALYTQVVSCQSYWPHIKAPILFLEATNDFNAPADLVAEGMALLPAGTERMLAMAPHLNHRFTNDTAGARFMWMEAHLKGSFRFPKVSATQLLLDTPDQVPVFRVTVDQTAELPVEKVEIYYGCARDPRVRFWRSATVTQESAAVYSAPCPVFDAAEPLFAFANISYKMPQALPARPGAAPTDLLTVSSQYQRAYPDELRAAGIQASAGMQREIEDFSRGWQDWYRLNPENPHHWFYATRKLIDPAWMGPKGARLAIELETGGPANRLAVGIEANTWQGYTGRKRDSFHALVDLTQAGPHAISLAPSDFKNAAGEPMRDWDEATELTFRPAKRIGAAKEEWQGRPLVLKRLHWQGGEQIRRPHPHASRSEQPSKTGAFNDEFQKAIDDSVEQEQIDEKVTPPQTKAPALSPKLYLSKELASHAESFVKIVNDGAWGGGPIRVGGREYSRGLGVHAESKLVFPLEGAFTSFYVIPGPDDGHHGQIEMKILVDGEERWSSGPTRSHEKTTRRRLSIPVKGAQTLTLIVTQSDGNGGGDHASWANAYLKRPSTRSLRTAEFADAKALPQVRHQLEPFLKTYCFRCHGPKKQKGQLRFDRVAWAISNNDNAQRWQDVLDQLNGGDMPPEDAKQPPPDELAAALGPLTGAILEARRRLTDHGGEITMRRLNQREYSATIRELFGFDVLHEDIPEDGEVASFDTVGAEQFFSSAHFGKYLELGEKVAQEALRWNRLPRKEPEVVRRQPEEKVNQRLREEADEMNRLLRFKAEGQTWQEMGFNDVGAMKQAFDRIDREQKKRSAYLANPKSASGGYITNHTNLTTWFGIGRHTDIRGDYILRIRGGVVGAPDPMRRIARIDDDYGTKGTLGIQGTPTAPETVQIRLRQSMGRFAMNLKVSENVPRGTFGNSGWLDQHLTRLQGSADPLEALWIDWLELDGPHYPEQQSAFERILTRDGSTRISKMLRDEHAAELIEAFAFEAFRRKRPSPDYLAGLHTLFQTARSQGKHVRDALVDVLALILASPSFLYLQEAAPAADRGTALDNRELAVRLSYFLWSAPPDDALYAADLTDPATLAAQVERMLADPKITAFRDGFISQWAEFDRLNAITIDWQVEPRFNSGVRHAVYQEVREFFGVLMSEDLPARNLIDSDFITINPTLAAHYGIDGVKARDETYQKVMLPADSHRGGLMTQAAFLITGSNGERSSPVIRGALVMEKLLHDKPAPPPPNVPELGSSVKTPKSNREMVQLHQEQAVCASCHKKMDVIGFGLENFDPIGRWRDSERVGKHEFPIQPGGTLPDGSAFADVRELKSVLLDHEPDLARELLKSILAYGLGRSIEFSDADDV